MTLVVVQATGLVTIQDLGRPGHMHEGLAPGGALVRGALVAENRVVGNADGDAAIEVLGKLVVRAERDVETSRGLVRAGEQLTIESEPLRVAYLAIRGGVDAPLVLGSRATQLSAGIGARLRAGDRSSATTTRGPISDATTHDRISDATAPDRISDPTTHDRISDARTDDRISDTATRGRLSDGGTDDRISDTATRGRLSDGGTDDWISDAATRGRISDTATRGRLSDTATRGRLSDTATANRISDACSDGRISDQPIRVIAGPDFDAFESDVHAVLVNQTYKVLPSSDRVGTRLVAIDAGPDAHDVGARPLPRVANFREASRPMALGAIEVPADGQPIVLGPEHPTTGGYPIVGVVAHDDIDRLFSIRIGDTVRFEIAAR